jgi:carboxyl-terminal processing protease
MNLSCLMSRRLFRISVLTFVLLSFVSIAQAQKVESKDRDRAQVMLNTIKDKLKKNYYDSTFRGMDVDARFKVASDKIKEATSVGQIFGTIAQVLVELDDSHTFFMPPSRSVETDYGWSMQIIGDRAFITVVDKGSDAEAKGLKPGDEVVEAGGYTIDRSSLWKFEYLYNTLRPQPGIRVIVRSPNAEPRQLDLMAKQKRGKQVVNLTDYSEYMNLVRKQQSEDKLGRDRYVSFADQLLIWRMNEFDLADSQIDDAMARARKHKALILDLRGNGGGWVTTITRLVSNLFDRDIKIADTKSRKESKPILAKSRGEKIFDGKLIILVDSRSASASELLARTIQLEKRGTIIGDRTSGAVMAAQHYNDQVGLDIVIFYGVSITVSDLIMADGNSLEHKGVTPDEIKLPAAEDLAAGRDVVLAYAAAQLGVPLDPVEAGKLFPLDPKAKGN